MRPLTPTARQRIEAQGFTGLSDETLAGINYGLRVAPALCMAWATIGMATASPRMLWGLLPFALLGGILAGHPFDVFYNQGLRFVLGTPPLPPYPRQRRFACLLASLMIAGAALCFEAGHMVAGCLIAGSLAAAAGVNVCTGFCIPSFLCALFFGRSDKGSTDGPEHPEAPWPRSH